MRKLLLIALMLWAIPAMAADRYTSSTGNDANPGTLGSPDNLANGIAHEIGLVTPANGDRLFMCAGACDGSGSATITFTSGGYYFNSSDVTFPTGTSFANALTITPYPGETLTFQPAGGQGIFYFHGPAANGVIIKGPNLILDGTDTSTNSVSLLQFTGSFQRAQDMEIRNGRWGGVGGGNTAESGWNQYEEFINLHVHHNGNTCTAPCDPPHGIYLGAAIINSTPTNYLVDGGSYHDHEYPNGNASGIECYTGGPATLAGITIRNTVVYGNDYGIGVTGPMCPGALIYNNVVYGSTTLGIGINVSGTAKVYNNTVFGNSWFGIRVNPGGGGDEIRNNIAYGNAPNFENGGSGTVCANNIGITGCASNDSPADPLFVSEGAADFRLRTGSPAIGTGVFSALVTTDILGLPRPNPPSMGAYDVTGALVLVVSPSSGNQGATMNVNLTGLNTHFVNATSICVFSGTGITVNSCTVSSATLAVANITIAGGATLAFRNVTVTTGAEVVTSGNGFLVVGAPTAPTNLRTVFDPLIAVPRIALAAEGR